MGRKKSAKNYRQFYKDYYGIEFGTDMVIHHIDFDRTNNDIDNLLLMPAELHGKYHLTIAQLCNSSPILADLGFIDPDMRVNGNTNKANSLISLGIIFKEIDVWIQIKEKMEKAKQSKVKWSDMVWEK